MATVWAKNETNAVLASTSIIMTLKISCCALRMAFGDLDLERTAHTQLHTLKMMMGMKLKSIWPNLRC